MSNWVEYWDKDKELVSVVGSYVPRKGDWVKIKLRNKFQIRQVLQVIHQIDKTSLMKETFKVILT